jgi:hypothetical protein
MGLARQENLCAPENGTLWGKPSGVFSPICVEDEKNLIETISAGGTRTTQ